LRRRRQGNLLARTAEMRGAEGREGELVRRRSTTAHLPCDITRGCFCLDTRFLRARGPASRRVWSAVWGGIGRDRAAARAHARNRACCHRAAHARATTRPLRARRPQIARREGSRGSLPANRLCAIPSSSAAASMVRLRPVLDMCAGDLGVSGWPRRRPAPPPPPPARACCSGGAARQRSR
jgi:hypothetical protein